ncbi:hypothetical protein [Curtobacterium flaccumfaciens]|uniref:hypothetical protein n=1 Tax=Curtobacterium flaccumfaciens TaxID=2035 RepID=UPI0016041E3E|nr:hypothetical protein [Curtobacterium flaccumfaciens]MBB1198635.1 hypothetical protein [Curtobacterium flaccumfaciens]
MNTAAELTSTVSALGREVPIWAFPVVAVLLVLGGVASIVVRRTREASGEGHSSLTPLPSTTAVLFVAATVVFLPVFTVLVQAF